MRHPYHLVDLSPWPISMAFGVFTAAIAMVSWLGNYTISNIYVLSIVILMLFIPYVWWRDVSREAKAGYHTLTVQRGIQIGFLLFLLSEIMLFVSFFWGYLHSCLAPVIELGSVWPPVGVYAIQPFGLPLVGTCILLASGFILTLAHHALILGNKSLTLIGFILTTILGISFVFIQFNEYLYAPFSMQDSSYGTTLFALSGLHGIHVIIGVIFLSIGLIRIFYDDITTEHHCGIEFSIYYWHLVDLVWIFLFLIVYWFGS